MPTSSLLFDILISHLGLTCCVWRINVADIMFILCFFIVYDILNGCTDFSELLSMIISNIPNSCLRKSKLLFVPFYKKIYIVICIVYF